jgi:hypothetical protein
LWDADGDGPGFPVLAVFGIFDAIDGKPFDRAALWDGDWHPLPEVPGGGNYFGAAQFDEDGPGPAGPSLFVAGSMGPHVVRWSGQEWTTVGDGFEGDGPVRWIKVLDPDGTGPAPAALYVGGRFALKGIGLATLARWDGARWGRLGLMSDLIPSEGDTADAAFFAPDDHAPASLYAVGSFNRVDGIPSSNMAVLECDEAPCPADCNADGALDLFDFLCFVNHYNTHDPAADCTAEGDFDFFDFVCFINLFNAGC